MKKTLLTILSLAAALLVTSAQAQTIVFSSDFSSGYTSGNLVGQNGWNQTGTTATVAQTVSNGTVLLPSGAAGQDTYNAFSSTVNSTVSGDYLISTINFSITNAANTTGDYFFNLSSPVGTTSTFFQRLYSRNATEGGGFQLGINGASAASAAGWGSTLSLNTAYKAVIKWDFISGTLNDTLTLYVNPTDPILTNNTPYATSSFTTTEPTTVAAANLRIGSSAATPGVLVDSIQVEHVPEPSTWALIGLGAAFVLWRIRRKPATRA
jgi:hypothetical protein